MLNLRTLSNDLFTIPVYPAQKISTSFVLLKADGTLHLSGQIAKAFYGKELDIRFDKRYDLIQISINDGTRSKDECLIFPKNGSRKIEPLSLNCSKFPIKYIGYFCEKGKVWRGQHVEDPFEKSAPISLRKKKN